MSITKAKPISDDFKLGLYMRQDGKCPLCDTDLLGAEHPVCIDHCHASGTVRGLLHGDCNIRLGVVERHIRNGSEPDHRTFPLGKGSLGNAMRYLGLDAPYGDPSDTQRVRELILTMGMPEEAVAKQIEIDAPSLRGYCAGKKVPRVVILALERLVDLHRRVGK